MRIVRAESMGMCFGVKDALVELDAIAQPWNTVIHGELVHNERVLEGLRERGFRMLNEQDRHDLPEASLVVITAHGVSERERGRIEREGRALVDTTCPLVHRVHSEARRLEQDGCFVVVIGKRGHVEVDGIVGDLEHYAIVESVQEVRDYGCEQLGIVCQTTAAPDLVAEVLLAIRAQNRNAKVRFRDTICQPTRERQQALDRLLNLVDVVVVVGGKHSNNTRQLVRRSEKNGLPVHHVQSADDLDKGWFFEEEVVGLTAGTSTLDETTNAVATAIETLEPPLRRARSSKQWANAFRRNAGERRSFPWQEGAGLTADERRQIADSIAEFQLGESSEGRHLIRQAESYARRVNDPSYVDAIRLLIREEQRHAGDLGRFMDLAEIPRLSYTWPDAVFRRLRRLAGLELSIAILVMAELIAKVYYSALCLATGSRLLQAMCEQILIDEEQHVRFQCERLHRIAQGRSGFVRVLWNCCFRLTYTLTIGVVWWKHRSVLRCLCPSLPAFARASFAVMRSSRILG